MSLFKQLNVDVLTRWRAAYELLLESEDWQEDTELRKLPTLDILLAFEDYSRVREREYEEQTRRAQVEKTRKERKTREAFKVRCLIASIMHGMSKALNIRHCYTNWLKRELLKPAPNGRKSTPCSRTTLAM